MAFNKRDVFYDGIHNLKKAGVQLSWTKHEISEFEKCRKDIFYFIENYVYIRTVDKGPQKFKLRPYQRKMIQAYVDERFVVSRWSRQAGKSTTTLVYLLWNALFNKDWVGAVFANREKTAIKLLSMLKYSYVKLPLWLQKGVIAWRETFIELENGSRIEVDGTNGNSGRGSALSCVVLDEFAFVETGLADAFINSVYPTISSSETAKILVTSTPKGYNHFWELWKNAEAGINGYKTLSVSWKDIPGRTEEWAKLTIAQMGEQAFNQEQNCEFLGSANTLIESKTLEFLANHVKLPIETAPNLDIYEQPREDHFYVMIVDTSKGLGLDYHAALVIDVTVNPYKVVAVYRSNMISTMLLPHVLYSIATKYNDAYTLVELNALGEQVANILYTDLEYTNLFKTVTRGPKGQVLISGQAPEKIRLGVTTSTKTKSVGCSNIKTILEKNRMIIPDTACVQELTSFTQKGDSFQADSGRNDDLAMCLVLFGWLSTQPFFREVTETNIREIIFEKTHESLKHDLPTSFFFGAPGSPEEELDEESTFVEDGLLWTPIDAKKKIDFWEHRTRLARQRVGPPMRVSSRRQNP